MGEIIALYFLAVFEDGDWLNDWLTHMPDWLAEVMMFLGQSLAYTLGL